MDAASLTLQMNTENTLIPVMHAAPRTLELLVRAPHNPAHAEKRAALNLALVLDRSGSMHGDRLEYARQAAAHVLDLLAEGDRACIVAFDDQVQLVAESTPITPAARADLKRRLMALRSGGSTNLSGGWLRGCEQVALQMGRQPGGQLDRALLLTDGQANAGIVDLEALSMHARELAMRGISTSTFGVGRGYNEHLLEMMAQEGRGSFYFIEAPADIVQIFNQEFEELSAITARDVEIELSLPAGVRANVLGGVSYAPAGERSGEPGGAPNNEPNGAQYGAQYGAPSGGKLRFSLGSLAGGREQGVYLDLLLPPAVAGQAELTLQAVARANGLGGALLEASAGLAFQYCADQAAVDAAPRRDDVLQRAALVRISQAANEALKLERAGRGDAAASLLESALETDRAYLPAEQQRYNQGLVQKMQAGLDESDRKSAHYDSYLKRKQRHDPTFDKRHGGAGSAALVQHALVRQMIQDGQIRLRDGAPLQRTPPALPASFDFARIEGMLLGLAVGDALGNRSESLTASERRARFGEITGYLPNPHAGGQALGVPSDDSQMAFWTLESLLDAGRLDPQHLAERFSRERIFGIGSTVRQFLRNFKDQGRPWREAGVESAGNGALMRIAPVLLPHLNNPTPGLWADAALAGMVTHNDYASNAACVAFVAMLWELLGMHAPPRPQWWHQTFVHLAKPLEGQTPYTARMPGLSYRGPLWQFVQNEVGQALQDGWTSEQASSRWGSGAFLLETVPNVLFILARYGHDPEQAILRAVNDTYDNDTIGAIVGAAVGALHGKAALPERWLAGLLGRTNDHNDGHVFQLIEQAWRKFWR